jgi:hypothetical protein
MPWFMSLAPQNFTLKACMANSILGHRETGPRGSWTHHRLMVNYARGS